MMTKVEELREIAIHVAAMGFGEMSEYHGYNIEMYNEEKEAKRLVDDIITAAKKEVRDEGWAATKLLWKRMGEWEKEWRAEHPKERELTSPDALQLIEWLIAHSREEGAELERARIRDSNPFVFTGEYYVLPASVLAPKEEGK